MPRDITLKLNECPVCGKRFKATAEWAYKAIVTDRYRPVCSYACMRKIEINNAHAREELQKYLQILDRQGEWSAPRDVTPEKKGIYAVKRRKYDAGGSLTGIEKGIALFIPAGEIALDSSGKRRQQGAHTWRNAFAMAQTLEVEEWYNCAE